MKLVDYASVDATRADPRWRPLQVTAEMGEPIVGCESGLHLDGPLSWGAFLAHQEEHGLDTLPPMAEWAMDFELPLARWAVATDAPRADPRLLTPDGRAWGWCCSDVDAAWLLHGKAEVRKRPDVSAMLRYTSAGSYSSAGGPLKAKDIAYPTRFARELRWYALGDAVEVRALLERVTHVGKLSGHGYGAVLRWHVEEAAEDWSIEREGRLTRRMPMGWRPDAAPYSEDAAIRAPYHHRSRVVPCLPEAACR